MVFILDRSGSMHGLEGDTIGGYNGLLEKQKKEQGDAVVTTVLFNTEHSVIHDRVNLQDVKPLTGEDCFASGGTALMDATGDTIEKISHLQKHLREEDRPGKTVVCIITDGMENSSVRYRKKDIKKLISDLTEKDKWEFIFLGANIDAASEAEGYGIRRDRAVKYCSDSKGTRFNYESLNSVMCCMREPSIDESRIDDVLNDLRKKNKTKTGSKEGKAKESGRILKQKLEENYKEKLANLDLRVNGKIRHVNYGCGTIVRVDADNVIEVKFGDESRDFELNERSIGFFEKV